MRYFTYDRAHLLEIVAKAGFHPKEMSQESWELLIDSSDLKRGDEIYALENGLLTLYKVAPSPRRMPIYSLNAAPAVTLTESKKRELLSRPITDLNVSTKAMKALLADDIVAIGDLVRLGRNGALKIPGFGRRALSEVIREFNRLGLTFAVSEHLLSQPLDFLELPVRSANALRSMNIFTLGDVSNASKKEVLLALGSKKAFDELVDKAAEYDIVLKL